ncbi:RAP domain protein [Babesia caballi]|uniref:RAP domain protein n=1 Tax=Babesia caballi TaxID=5871 RepID=A0AAV4LX93_BABCB|nr:RAP domain protein [Babesia caballi]
MTACRCAVAAMLQRRCVGYVARHGSAGAGKRIEKPCDVARYIEKVAKELGADRRQKERGNCKELVDAMCANITQYTAMEVRAVAHGMPLIFGRDVDGAWLQTIATFTLKRAYMMPVYLLYPIVNSLARMTKDASGLPMDQLLQACRERVEEANSIDLATMAQTATLLRRTPVVEGVMQDVANRAVTEEILGEISATNAVLILYAFAQMGIKHEKMYPTLKQVIKKMDHDDFQPHLIPIALHALARFGSRDRPVLETVANHAVKVTHEMQPENVSGTVCALAKLKFRHSLLLREMAKRTRQLMDDVNVREMSMY